MMRSERYGVLWSHQTGRILRHPNIIPNDSAGKRRCLCHVWSGHTHQRTKDTPQGQARCPICGTVTRFQVDNRRIEDLAPKDPALHVVEIEQGPGRMSIKCDSTHIFGKKDCLTKWLSNYTGKPGLVISLPEYMDSLNKRPPRKVSPA